MNDLKLEEINPNNLGRFEDLIHEPSANMLFGSLHGIINETHQTLAWQVLRGGETVAIAIVEIGGDNIGHINIAVDPSARRQGVGSKALSLICIQQGINDLRSLKAQVTPSNTGAQKILVNNGFSRIGFSAEGYLEFEKR